MSHQQRPSIAASNPSYVRTVVQPLTSSVPLPNTSSSSTSSAPKAGPILPQEAARTVNLGTRKSHLARVQTDLVVAALQKEWPQHTYIIHAISTMGDKNQVTALHDFGAKSLWTYELEAMLLQGEVDAIVHCLKGV